MSISGVQGQVLEVTVVGCNKLKDTEWISRQDPYVCLEYGSSKHRTRTCTDGGKNPTFQEKFMFTMIEGLREIQIAVWNSNTLTVDDFIGNGKVQLPKVLSQGFDDTAWPIQDRRNKHAGEVRLIMHYANAKKPTSQSPTAPPYSAPPSHSVPPHHSAPPPYSAPPPNASMYSAPPPNASMYSSPPPNASMYSAPPPAPSYHLTTNYPAPFPTPNPSYPPNPSAYPPPPPYHHQPAPYPPALSSVLPYAQPAPNQQHYSPGLYPRPPPY